MSRLDELVRLGYAKANQLSDVVDLVDANFDEIARGYGYESTIDRMCNRVWPLPELLMIPWILQTALFDKNVLVYCTSIQEARGMLDAMIAHASKQYGRHIVRSARRDHAGGEVEFINEFRIVFAVPSRSSNYGPNGWVRVRGIR